MNSQKSYQEVEKGILYLVPTPIGNLEDMTFRAIRILKEADYIAAEDTRNTRKLLNHFEIKTPMFSYHEHNKLVSGEKIIQYLRENKTIALVSDAGMPAISDPGYEIARDAISEGFPVISLPGANAALTALTASGLPSQPFYFYGFLSRKKKEREKELALMKNLTSTIIFYEAPHRLKETLQAMIDVFGNRKIVLARELTKRYEEYLRGTLVNALAWVKTEEVRGEFCLVVEGADIESIVNSSEEVWWASLSVKEHVEHYIEQGDTSKQAIKKTAKDRDMDKRKVYHIFHVE